jgi:hypothetical protein
MAQAGGKGEFSTMNDRGDSLVSYVVTGDFRFANLADSGYTSNCYLRPVYP